MRKILSLGLAFSILVILFSSIGFNALAQEAIITYVNPKTTNAEAYQVAYNADIGTPIHGGTSSQRPISDFGETELEGATILQTAFADGLTAAGYSGWEKWMSFTIDQSAEVYVLTYMKSNGDSYLKWLITEDWELVKDEFGNEILLKAQNNEQSLYLYRKTFSVEQDETREVSLNNYGRYGNGMYAVAIKWADQSLMLDSIKINGTPIDGFDNSVLNYTYYNLKSDDVITANPIDPTSTVDIIRPMNNVGDLLVKVTNQNNVERIFTINCQNKDEVKIVSTLSTKPENYKVLENVQVGSDAFGDGSRKISDFGGTGLEGNIVIQTHYSDRTDANNNIQSPESGSTVTWVDWLTLSINRTANIYVLCNFPAQNNYMTWLLNMDWEQMEDGLGNPLKVILTPTPETDNYFVYKKTFVVDPGELREVSLKNMGFFGNRMYFAMLKWTEGYQITVNNPLNGKISKSGVIDVEKDETVSFTVTPDEGYMIDYIKFNNNIIESDYDGIYSFTTEEITEDSSVEVAFKVKVLPLPEELVMFPDAFTPGVAEEFKDENGIWVTRTHGIVFAKAPENYINYTRIKFGMLISTNEELSKDEFILNNIGTLDLVDAEGTALPNLIGDYGIRFYGNAIVKNKTYYTRAYAIYEDDEEETVTVYGDQIVPFTPLI